MYVDLGQNAVIKDKEIIGIFDLDTSTVSKKTRDYLAKAEKDGSAVTVSLYELPRSFIVAAADKKEQKVIVSPLSVNAITAKNTFINRGSDPKEK